MFHWSTKNKCKAKKQKKSDSKNKYAKFSDELLLEESELYSENQSDLIKTKTSLQPSKETSPSLDDNVTTTDGYSEDTGISLEVIEFVKKALEVYFTNCHVSSDLMEICDYPDLKITPTENRKQLIVHNTQENNCKIYQCYNKHKKIIFIFLTFEEINSERKYYITSPSLIPSNYYVGETVPCVSVEITEALNETPLAVAKLLCRIQTRPLPGGLSGGRFSWTMMGTDERFTIKQNLTNVYWSVKLDDDKSDHIIKMDSIFRRNCPSFDFRMVRELTPTSETTNSRIPCASPVDITDALKCGNLFDQLFNLTTKEGEHTISSSSFKWSVHESSFVVSSHKMGTIDGLGILDNL